MDWVVLLAVLAGLALAALGVLNAGAQAASRAALAPDPAMHPAAPSSEG